GPPVTCRGGGGCAPGSPPGRCAARSAEPRGQVLHRPGGERMGAGRGIDGEPMGIPPRRRSSAGYLGSMSRQEIGVPVAAELVGAERTQLLQQLERAEVRIEEIRRHLERADQAIARTMNGQDGEGAVEIVLGAGGHVDAVHLDPDWRELVDEQGLPAAVTEAFRAAHGSRLSDWCGALRESLGARGWVPLSLRTPTEPPDAPQLAGPDPDLGGITPDLADEQVATQVRAALDQDAGAGSDDPAAAGVDSSQPTGPRQLRERLDSAFASL